MASDSDYVNKLKVLFEQRQISRDGIAVITVQKNRTTDFSSLVVDFTKQQILPHYSSPIPTNRCKQLSIGESLLVTYSAGLSQSAVTAPGNANQQEVYNKPFCCNHLVPYREQTIARETVFKEFLARKNGMVKSQKAKRVGNHKQMVFEVKCQEDNGPLLATDYFMLLNSRIEQVYGKFNKKLHAFKNYKCPVHGLFYSVDLYSSSEASGYNFHHMRLFPFTKIDKEFMEEFFKQAEKESSKNKETQTIDNGTDNAIFYTKRQIGCCVINNSAFMIGNNKCDYDQWSIPSCLNFALSLLAFFEIASK